MKNARIVILYYKLSFLILFLLLKSALLLAHRGCHLQPQI